MGTWWIPGTEGFNATTASDTPGEARAFPEHASALIIGTAPPL